MAVYYLHTLKLTPVPTSEEQQGRLLAFITPSLWVPSFLPSALPLSLPPHQHSLIVYTQYFPLSC